MNRGRIYCECPSLIVFGFGFWYVDVVSVEEKRRALQLK